MKLPIFLLMLLEAVQQISGQAFHLKFHQSPHSHFKCILIDDDFFPKYRGLNNNEQNAISYSTKPAMSASSASCNLSMINRDDKIMEVFAHKRQAAEAFMESMCKSIENVKSLAHPNEEIEIRKIVDGGDQRNRIDVVFMGDGYNASERQKFFSDIERLTKDMFEGVTFRSYLPLFNIWAIYVESTDSGIGYDGPKDTPFRLYREGGQLRVIYPGNSTNARRVCAMTGSSGCDYPSIIGNDDFYGGVGGEFVVSTRSHRTGTTVLRHELGHNLANVGDEYDNSWAYFGANSASSPSSLSWGAWLTGERREERAIFRLLEYPWADLSKGPRSFTFTSDGDWSRWILDISVSAAGEEDSLEFMLDGEVLPWKTTGFDDREFYLWSGNEGLTAGLHNFTVRSKTPSTHPDIPRMICSVRLHEFGNENEFHMSNSHVSAYPTWSDSGSKTFRPTNEGCLMRNMTSDHFCSICKESMWSEFLQRVSIIDNVTVSESSQNGTREVAVLTMKLGQKREPGNEVPGEALEIRWFKGTQEQVAFRDQFIINAEPGTWSVEVHLNTREVRHDPRGLLTSTEAFVVPAIP